MIRKYILFVAAFAAFSCQQAFSQDYQLSHLNQRGYAGMPKQARVETLPSNYFEDEFQDASGTTAIVDESSARRDNLLVLSGFTFLLVMGSVITGSCMLKNRRSNTQSAPLRMVA